MKSASENQVIALWAGLAFLFVMFLARTSQSSRGERGPMGPPGPAGPGGRDGITRVVHVGQTAPVYVGTPPWSSRKFASPGFASDSMPRRPFANSSHGRDDSPPDFNDAMSPRTHPDGSWRPFTPETEPPPSAAILGQRANPATVRPAESGQTAAIAGPPGERGPPGPKGADGTLPIARLCCYVALTLMAIVVLMRVLDHVFRTVRLRRGHNVFIEIENPQNLGWWAKLLGRPKNRPVLVLPQGNPIRGRRVRVGLISENESLAAPRSRQNHRAA